MVAAEGLASIHAPALASIADAPGIDTHLLAERLAIDPAKARRIVGQLKGRNLIETFSVEGRRSPGLRLTPAGAELRERLRPQVTAVEDRILAPLSESERELLKELLSRVIKANDAKEEGVGGAERE